MKKRFWLTFFLPVNFLFHGLMIWLLGMEPSLENALWVVVVVKVVYFASVTYAVLVLNKLWPLTTQGTPPGACRSHQILGLLSIAILLGSHGERTYQFGQLEREMVRNRATITLGLSQVIGAGITLDNVRLENRDWIYEYKMAGLVATQIDRVKFGQLLRQPLLGETCRDGWLQRLVRANIRVHYLYRDQHGDVLADEIIGKSDCPPPLEGARSERDTG